MLFSSTWRTSSLSHNLLWLPGCSGNSLWKICQLNLAVNHASTNIPRRWLWEIFPQEHLYQCLACNGEFVVYLLHDLYLLFWRNKQYLKIFFSLFLPSHQNLSEVYPKLFLEEFLSRALSHTSGLLCFKKGPKTLRAKGRPWA